MKNRGIIFVIAVIVLIGGVFLYKEKKPVIEDTAPIGETTTPETVSPDVEKSVVVVPSQGDISLKFNAAIAKAQGLFAKADYVGSISAYNEALKIKKSEYAYSGRYFAELALKQFVNAEKTILLAIGQNKTQSDYWNWYLTLLQEKLGASRAKLDSVYTQAYQSVLSEKKINVVTHYAQILTALGDKQGAIAQWEKAIEIYPQNKVIYQTEIDSLKK